MGLAPASNLQSLSKLILVKMFSQLFPKERLVVQTAHRHLTTWLDSLHCRRQASKWQTSLPVPGVHQECRRTTPPSALTTHKLSFLRLCPCLHRLTRHNRKTSVVTLHRFAELDIVDLLSEKCSPT